MLFISHLTKTYGGKKAVDDLSLHIAPGEIHGFIGHNGAGKTTTTSGRTPSPAKDCWPTSPITQTCMSSCRASST